MYTEINVYKKGGYVMYIIFIVGTLLLMIANFIIVKGKINLMVKAMILAIIGNLTLTLFFISVEEYHTVLLNCFMLCFSIYGLKNWTKQKKGI